MNILKGKLSILLLASAFTLGAQVKSSELSEYGSDKSAHTIYTNPAQDCSTTMNISWASPPGTRWTIELTDETARKTYFYDYDETAYEFPYLYNCETFNNIPSKLKDKTSVTEKHIFDKHGYELYELEPDRDYRYRIITLNDSTGRQEYSEVYRFHTAGADSWKAAVIGDFHHYSPLPYRLDAAMSMLDVIARVSGGFDWVLSTGDVCAHGASFNLWTELSEQPHFKNYMWATVQGNHDTMASDKRVSDNFFRDSHFFPGNGYEGQEGVAYWFRYGDVLFLMLNNEAMRREGGVAPAISWMEKVVEGNPSKYIVAVEHYQWLNGTNGANSQLDKFYKTFDRLGVDIAISGNNHVYLRTLPLKDRLATDPGEGTYYVVTPCSDNDRGRNLSKLVANEEIIEKRWSEGPKTVGAMLMDVNPKRIKMTLYNRDGEIQDSFTVPAKR